MYVLCVSELRTHRVLCESFYAPYRHFSFIHSGSYFLIHILFHALKIKYPEIRNFQSGFNVFRGGGGGAWWWWWGGGVALLKHSLDFALFNNAHLQHNFDNLELARTFLFGRKSPPPPPKKKKRQKKKKKDLCRDVKMNTGNNIHTQIYIYMYSYA